MRSAAPENMKDMYMQPKLEDLMRKIPTATWSRTSTRRTSTSTRPSRAVRRRSAARISPAWSKPGRRRGPVFDMGNVFCLTSHTAYGNMMADTGFYQESIVGINVAELAPATGDVRPAVERDREVRISRCRFSSTREAAGFVLPSLRHRWRRRAAPVPPAPPAGSGIEESYVYPFANAPQFPVQIPDATQCEGSGHRHSSALYVRLEGGSSEFTGR